MVVKIGPYTDIPPILKFLRIRFSADTGYVVKALCYKPEGCGIEIRWAKRIFLNVPNPSSLTRF
jgi:hypothetical protein